MKEVLTREDRGTKRGSKEDCIENFKYSFYIFIL